MLDRRHWLGFICWQSTAVFLATASPLSAPPGCTCTEPCSALGSCKIPASERHTCPYVWWDTPEFGAYASCVDARQLRVINDFHAFPANAAGAITWDLPCASLSPASESLGFKSDVSTSPCFFPEITALYAEALQDATYASNAQVLKVRANVIDVSGLTTTTTTHWCRGYAFVSDSVGCLCLNGGNSCQGTGCSNYDTSSWYDETCTACNCTSKATSGSSGSGRFSQVIFEKAISLMNTRKDVSFLNFSAAAYRSKVITQKEYDRIFRNGFDTSSSIEVRYLFELFDAPYDAQMPGNSATRHNMSEYLEMFVVPTIGDGGTSGLAHSRGQEVNDSLVVPPAIYISERDSDTVEKAAPLIGHELGHTLGLLHTFSGLKLASLQNSTCPQCIPTEANAATSGDFITDTPPTSSLHAGSKYPAPIASNLTECTISFNSSGLCVQLPGGSGNMRNLMAYGADECQSTFTAQQLARMRCWMDQDFSRTHLPNLGPGLVLLSASYIKAACKVQLAWLPPVSEVWCPQALCSVTSYRIQRKTNAGAWEVIGTTQGAKRFFDDTDILNGNTYGYQVMALGPGGEGSAVTSSVVIDQGCTSPTPSPSPSLSPSPSPSPSLSPSPTPSPSPLPTSKPAGVLGADTSSATGHTLGILVLLVSSSWV